MKTIRTFFLLTILALSPFSYANTTTFTPAQQAQIQTIVHDYLLNNPQMLVQMATRLQQNKIQQATNDNIRSLFFTPASPTMGNAKGDVTIVEFLDYQCPHCKHSDAFINQLLTSDPGVRVIYKEIPIFGDMSEFAVRAALASQQQGKFAAMHDALIKAKAPFNKQQILDIANSVGLDVAKLQNDMNSDAIDQEIKNSEQLAAEFNLPGTPAFVITTTPASTTTKLTNVFLIPGDTDLATLKQRVSAARNKTS